MQMLVLKPFEQYGRGGFALSSFLFFLSRPARRFFLLLFLGAVCFLSGLQETARAQTPTSNDVQARISRIENEIQTLSRAVFRGDTPPPEMMATVQADQSARAETERRLDALENALRTLTGKFEEQGFATETLSRKLDKNLIDIGMRLDALERTASGNAPGLQPTLGTPPQPIPPQSPASSVASQPSSAPQMPPTQEAEPDNAHILGQIPQTAQGQPASPAAGTSQDDPATQYEQAFTALRNGDYAIAGTQFEQFLARNPDHALAPNAKYWLGESYYARKDYEKAARTFAEAYQRYPKSAKTPDNLLKLALSLAGMGNKKDACVAFSQLRHEYPDGTGPVLARAAQEMKTLGCP